MDFLIFDFSNEATTVHTDDTKEIEYIDVTILTGDERVAIAYTDGSYDRVDSSDNRQLNFYDGGYIVTADEIDDWIAAATYETAEDYKNHTISYRRQNWAYNGGST